MTIESNQPVSLARLFLLWCRLGATSFGGGSAIKILLPRLVVEEEHWMTEEEFVQLWTMIQIAPGINTLSFILLAGKRVRGYPGSLVALLGFLLPSVAITLLLTILYTHYKDVGVIPSAIKGITPALVGLNVQFGVRLATPPLNTLKKKGGNAIWLGIFALLASAAIVFFQLPVVAAYFGSAFLIALFHQWSCNSE